MPFVLFVIRPARCLGDDASYLRLYQSHLDWCVPSAFAHSAARIRLSEILLAGDIPVTCAEDGRIRPVTPEELQAGYRVDTARSVSWHTLLPGKGGNSLCGSVRAFSPITTLRLLAEEAAAVGAATVGLNPLHALFSSDPDRASPYHPSDRRFLDPLAIDAFSLPAPLLTARVRAAIAQAVPEASRLSAKPLVDYAAAAALKNPLFDAAHAAFRDLARNRPRDPLVEDHAAFVRECGETLRRFAIFAAIETSFNGACEKFPEPLKSSQGKGVSAFAAAHADAISKGMFLQWLADRQFAAAARACGLNLGFYRDIAVGCAPDGAEAWAEPELFLRGVSIGAPPDPLGPNGQVWNLPPYDPRALARGGFAAFGQLIAANMAHAGILRIDHVLGLNRFFLVPEGAEGREGA